MIYAILTGLAIIAGLLARRRVASYYEEQSTTLTDDHIRQVEHSGHVSLEEPLDLDQAREEEAEFWEESSWEEPDELGG